MDIGNHDFEHVQEAQWDVKSCVRCIAGATLDLSNLPNGMKRIPKGTPLRLTSARKAIVIKTATVVTAAAKDATSLEIAKGSLFQVGDTIAGSTISAIDTSNETKDVLTVTALAKAVAKNAIVDDGNIADIIGLLYATTKLTDPTDRYPSATWTIQAYEIREETLPFPLSADAKTALTSRHHWALF